MKGGRLGYYGNTAGPFWTTATRIYAGNASTDLHLEADDDIYLNPDDDIIIFVGGTNYAMFDGGDYALALKEKAGFPAGAAGWGYLTVLADTPNALFFTDDESNDWCVSGCGDNATQRTKNAVQTIGAAGGTITWPTSVDAGLGWTYAAGAFTATRDGRARVEWQVNGYTATNPLSVICVLLINGGAVMPNVVTPVVPVGEYVGALPGFWEGAITSGQTVAVYCTPSADSFVARHGRITLRWVKP